MNIVQKRKFKKILSDMNGFIKASKHPKLDAVSMLDFIIFEGRLELLFKSLTQKQTEKQK